MSEPTHVEWQAQVEQLAALYGWKHLTVRRSVGRGGKHVTTTNRKGWPDLFLWHPGRGGFVAIELKVGRDRPTPEQDEVLKELVHAGATVMVAWPRDLDEVHRLLAPERVRS